MTNYKGLLNDVLELFTELVEFYDHYSVCGRHLKEYESAHKHLRAFIDDAPNELAECVDCYPMDKNDEWIKNYLKRAGKKPDTGKIVVKAAQMLADAVEKPADNEVIG